VKERVFGVRRQHYEMKRSVIAHLLWSGRGGFLFFCCSREWRAAAAFATVSAVYRRLSRLPRALPSPEDVVHDLGAGGDDRPQFPAVDDLGGAGGGVPGQVGDFFDADAVVAHQADERGA
jgi:hypothetical protein